LFFFPLNLSPNALNHWIDKRLAFVSRLDIGNAGSLHCRVQAGGVMRKNSRYGFWTGIAFVTLSASVALTRPAAAQDCGYLQTVASVSLQPSASRLQEFVGVKLNGAEKTFLLDTGGYTSQVTPKTVAELKLPFGGTHTQVKFVGGQTVVGGAIVADFQMGTMRAKDIPLEVSPLSLSADGILGPDLFLAYDLDMDFGHDKLNFISSDHCPGQVVYWKADAVAEVPMRIVSGHYLINITLDGTPLVAMVDTGAVRTSMGLQEADHNFSLSPSSPEMEPGPKFNGSVASWMHKFAALSFNGVTIQNPTIAVLKSNALERDHYSTGTRITGNTHLADIILGMDIMRHLHIYIATKERKIYITPA
jgi:predicted aspartyl protease